MYDWLVINYIEITGAVLGVLFLFFEIKQNWLLWPLGILTSLFYIFIFYQAKFYADMGLQFYYVLISIYGWYYWWRGGKASEGDSLSIVRLTSYLSWILLGLTIVLFVLISFILVRYTDSPVPYWDAFTTALSITATWMLARKILEQWWLWMLVNSVSLGLYIYKGLYPTVVLFAFYTVLSYVGYVQWMKTYKLKEDE
jgi:nicotinamide mononucleotide transporter